MERLLIRLFNLPREHARRALLMFGGLMCVAAAGLSARTVGDTLFLIRYGAGWMAYMYIATALTVTGAALVLRRLARVYPLHRLVAGFVLALGLVALGLRGALLGGPAWLAVPVYLWADVVATLVVVQFWTFVGSAFNAREAKRLFAFIGTGGTLSGALFGLLIRNYVRWIGPENLLIVVALLLGGFAVLLRLAARAGVATAALPGQQGRGAKRGPRPHASQVRMIGTMAVVATVALTLIDYQFKADARAHHPTGAELASFFGVFYACNSVVSLILQAFFVSRILKKGGVLTSLLILPGALLIGSAAILSTSAFEAIVATKFAHVLLFFTIDNTAFQILYLSIPPQGRGPARTFVDGMCRPVALGGAGLLLVLVAPLLAIPLVSAVALPLIAAWIGLVVVNFRRYLTALMDSLRRGRFDASGEAHMSDEASLEAMKRLLATGTDDEVLYVSELIRQMEAVDCTPEALAALERESPQVKVQALDYLRGRGRPVEIPGAEELLRHTDPAVRASAAAVVCLTPGSKALGGVEALLEDADARVRAEAAAGLIRCRGAEGARQAWPVLMGMVISLDAETRIWGARALGRAGTGDPQSLLKEDVQGLLLALLRDDVAAVRLAALRATERISCPEAIPLIVRMLAEDRMCEAAAQALVAHGDEGVDALRQAAEPDASGRLGHSAVRVPAVLARIDSRAAFGVLRGLLHARADGLRHAAIDAVCRLLRARPALRGEVEDLQDLLLAEVGRATVLQSLRDDFRGLEGTDLLMETLGEMRGGCLRRVFALLGVLFPQTDMEAIRRGVMEGAGEVRANALEVLDNTLKGEVHDRLLGPLLEPFGAPEGSAENATARLRALMEWNDGWLQACALHAAGRGRLAEALPEVEAAAESPDALVRETALWAREQITQKN